MSKSVVGLTKMQWCIHFARHHKRWRETPSTEEMLKYPQAFAEVFQQHVELHRHFYTGHEHNEDGSMKPGRTK